ncbi:MAG: OmpA family protein [Saprospiraceae bacterium]|nr:OmpA family protein [Saprospiraceae bacterium]
MKTPMKKLSMYFLAALVLLGTTQMSCSASRKTKGAVIGATVGGTAGALLTKKNKAVGILLGTAIGGVAGGLVGAYMDKQARDIADDLGENATVTRVGEGIVVSFDSGLLFDFDSYALRAETRSNLRTLATSLKEYDKTEVRILGHTDSQGAASYNKTLSIQRADAVAGYLSQLGITTNRISTTGYGESDPVADNSTAEGRQLNRRVEVVILADDELKKMAADGQLDS